MVDVRAYVRACMRARARTCLSHNRYRYGYARQKPEMAGIAGKFRAAKSRDPLDDLNETRAVAIFGPFVPPARGPRIEEVFGLPTRLLSF